MSPAVTSTLRFWLLRATKNTLPHNGLGPPVGSAQTKQTSRFGGNVRPEGCGQKTLGLNGRESGREEKQVDRPDHLMAQGPGNRRASRRRPGAPGAARPGSCSAGQLQGSCSAATDGLGTAFVRAVSEQHGVPFEHCHRHTPNTADRRRHVLHHARRLGNIPARLRCAGIGIAAHLELPCPPGSRWYPATRETIEAFGRGEPGTVTTSCARRSGEHGRQKQPEPRRDENGQSG